MNESTLARNHSAAKSVKRSSVNHSIWRHMKVFILMKNHSASQSVKRSSGVHTIWRHIEFILMKNHSAAQSVKRSSVIQHLKTHGRIHADEKPFRCLKCEKKFRCSHNLKTHRRIYNHSKKTIQLLKVWKKVQSITAFEDSWENSY